MPKNIIAINRLAKNTRGVKKKYLTPFIILSIVIKALGERAPDRCRWDMEKIVEQGILYDFYGALLTPHQREIYEAVVYENLSLGEIAADKGISRQGVHDLIRRCDKILENYEQKLHLVQRFMDNRKKLTEVREFITSVVSPGQPEKETILKLIDDMVEEL